MGGWERGVLAGRNTRKFSGGDRNVPYLDLNVAQMGYAFVKTPQAVCFISAFYHTQLLYFVGGEGGKLTLFSFH